MLSMDYVFPLPLTRVILFYYWCVECTVCVCSLSLSLTTMECVESHARVRVCAHEGTSDVDH